MDLEVNNYTVDSSNYSNSNNLIANTTSYEQPAIKYLSRSESLNFGTTGSAGLDLYVDSIDLSNSVIGTGINVEIPAGWVGFVVPRSSTGSKGFKLKNTMGVIDSDYRGEILIAYDKGYTPLIGEKIAQMVVVPCWTGAVIQMNSMDDLSDTHRGQDGFGSTGG